MINEEKLREAQDFVTPKVLIASGAWGEREGKNAKYNSYP